MGGRRSVARWALALGSVVLAAGCGSGPPSPDEDAVASSSGATSPTSPGTSAEPTPGLAQPIEPSRVAEALANAVLAATVATVSIDLPDFSFDGMADFTGPADDPGSLTGVLDLRESEEDAAYEARDGRVRVRVPAGMDFPASREAPTGNPWGQAMARVDPTTVALLISRFGDEASQNDWSSGRILQVRLRGPEVLAAFGYPESDAMPERVAYTVTFDDAGRLSTVVADFDRYGGKARAAFEDWQGSAA